jgi:hypothetical protein
MQRALDGLRSTPNAVLIDGNRWVWCFEKLVDFLLCLCQHLYSTQNSTAASSNRSKSEIVL